MYICICICICICMYIHTTYFNFTPSFETICDSKRKTCVKSV